MCGRYSLLASGERSERPVNRQSLVTLASGSGAARGGAGHLSNGPARPPPLLPPVPSAPPRKVEAEALNATAIRVLWRSPAPGRQHGQIRGYQVHYVRMEGAEARGPPRIKDIMLADAQVGGAPGGAWGRGWAGSLRSCRLAASLFFSLATSLTSSSLSCRLLPAQWEMDDTAEYVSSAPPAPSHCQCCESTPPCTLLVKGSPPLGPRCTPSLPLGATASVLRQTNGHLLGTPEVSISLLT